MMTEWLILSEGVGAAPSELDLEEFSQLQRIWKSVYIDHYIVINGIMYIIRD